MTDENPDHDQASPAPQSPSAVIELIRRPRVTAALTKFDVFMDDEKIDRIGNNEQVRYEVYPGRHILYLKLDNFSSQKIVIDLNPGDRTRFVCWPKPLGLGINIQTRDG